MKKDIGDKSKKKFNLFYSDFDNMKKNCNYNQNIKNNNHIYQLPQPKNNLSKSFLNSVLTDKNSSIFNQELKLNNQIQMKNEFKHLAEHLFAPFYVPKWIYEKYNVEDNTNDVNYLNLSNKVFNLMTENEKVIFDKITTTEGKKLAYSLLVLKYKKNYDEQKTIQEILKQNLKSIALGIFCTEHCKFILKVGNISYDLVTLKDMLPSRIYFILKEIIEIAQIYSNIKNEIKNPISFIHELFLKDTISTINEYESEVIKTEPDFIEFKYSLYNIFLKLKKINEMNIEVKKGISDRNNTQILKTNHNTQVLHLSPPLFYKLSFFEYYHSQAINYFVYNYLSTGQFYDKYNEFFINTHHTLDYGLVPSFITYDMAETILYIGKYRTYSPHDIISWNHFNIYHPDSATQIKNCLISLNQNLQYVFEKKINTAYNIINQIIFFAKHDFINFILYQLKVITNYNKQDMLTIIEKGLNYCGIDIVNSYISIDIKIFDENSHYESRNYSKKTINLYCKVENLLNLLFNNHNQSENSMLEYKLNVLFQFLWQLKRIELLGIKLNQKIDNNEKPLIHKLNCVIVLINQYIYYEVINNNLLKSEWILDNLAINLIKSTANKKIDIIITKLYLETKNKIIEKLFYNIENYFINILNNYISNDININTTWSKKIKQYANLFLVEHQKSIQNTFLYIAILLLNN